MLGGALLVFSRFLAVWRRQEPVPPPLADLERRLRDGNSHAPEPVPGWALENFVPYDAGQVKVPSWLLATCFLISLAGCILWFGGPGGVSPFTVITFGMMVGGPLGMLAAHFAYSGAAQRRNFLRGAMAIFSFFVLFCGIMTGVLAAAGAFDEGWRSPWVVAGASALLLGCCGAYYGLRYQQSREGLYIASRLGFDEASGGGEDAHYDGKGVLKGIEVLFDVTQVYPDKSRRANFRLEVLCRCGNSAGLALSIKPRGLLGISLSSLPAAGEIPSWEGFDVRCDRPEVALRLLSGFRKPGSVFDGRYGFESMRLEGANLKLNFSDKGYIGPARVKLVLDEASAIALLFR